MTDRQVRFIRDCYAVAMKQRMAAGFVRAPKGMYDRIARRFGISRRHVKAICYRENWRHLK